MSGPKPYIRSSYLMTHLVNPIVRRFGPVTTLTVVGRTSGQPRPVPLGAPFEYAGRRYLVSGRGETHWVRNLRAAGHASLRVHGRTERIQVREIAGAEREAVVTAYRTSLGHSGEPFFRQIPDPADHPTFLIQPDETPTT
jgi:deazaflavin-dependent oxidoreductase (nitroreductase family)